MSFTRGIQNVSGKDSTAGFFYGGFGDGFLTSVQVGWYAQGEGVTDAEVLSVDAALEVIIIQGPQVFLSGRSYSFTSYRVTQDPTCFNKGTKILCLAKELSEEYVPIENLQAGDVVKTYFEGYRKIHLIGKGTFVNNPDRWQACMFVYPKKGDMIDDLVVTGYHGIFVDEHEIDGEKSLKKYDRFLICAGLSSKCTKVTDTDVYEYYHLSLENDGYPLRSFVVYANGALAETTCENDFNTHLMVGR